MGGVDDDGFGGGLGGRSVGADSAGLRGSGVRGCEFVRVAKDGAGEPLSTVRREEGGGFDGVGGCR